MSFYDFNTLVQISICFEFVTIQFVLTSHLELHKIL
jgi:hypothetical protein